MFICIVSAICFIYCNASTEDTLFEKNLIDEREREQEKLKERGTGGMTLSRAEGVERETPTLPDDYTR